MFFGRDKQTMPQPDQALPGRSEAVPVQSTRLALGTPLDGPVPGAHARLGRVREGAIVVPVSAAAARLRWAPRASGALLLRPRALRWRRTTSSGRPTGLAIYHTCPYHVHGGAEPVAGSCRGRRDDDLLPG